MRTAKGRAHEGCFLAEGPRVVRQIQEVSPGNILEVLVTESRMPRAGTAFPMRTLTAAQFERVTGVKTPQGIAAVVTLPGGHSGSRLPDAPGTRLLHLEDVQDPGNVGTIVRTAAGLGFDGVLLNRGCADPFSPKAVQASAGSVVSIWLRRTDAYLECLRQLQAMGYGMVATSATGRPLVGWRPPKRLLLALGNEGVGLSDRVLQLATATIAIPQSPQRVESLNVAAAAAICMWVAVSAQ